MLYLNQVKTTAEHTYFKDKNKIKCIFHTIPNKQIPAKNS